MRIIVCQMLIAAAMSVSAHAQTPSVVTGGAEGVTINGNAAARQGDTTSDGSVIVEGSPNVFINGKPAAVVSGKTGCGGIVVGGIAGGIVAQKIKMTAMPQLVAFFHSLVGLAAVLVAAAALYAPESYGIGVPGQIHTASIVELSLGSAIGALTFTGSVIAFLKLNGNMSGAPIILPARHLINIAFGIAIIVLVVMMIQTEGSQPWMFLALTAIALVLGITLIIPIGGADMPVVVSMLNSYSGWAAAGIGFTLGNSALIITGALVGSSGAILSYIMCKGMNRSIFNVILGGFGTDAGGATAAAKAMSSSHLVSDTVPARA